jgi:hypothetical protein
MPWFDTRTMSLNGTYGGQGKTAAVDPSAVLLCLIRRAKLLCGDIWKARYLERSFRAADMTLGCISYCGITRS